MLALDTIIPKCFRKDNEIYKNDISLITLFVTWTCASFDTLILALPSSGHFALPSTSPSLTWCPTSSGEYVDAHGRLVAFDTLKSVDRLKGAKVPEEQARAFVEIFQEIQQGADLATKADLEQLRVATKSDLRELELRIETKIEATHTKLEATKVDMIKWVIGLLVAQTAILFTLFKFFL